MSTETPDSAIHRHRMAGKLLANFVVQRSRLVVLLGLAMLMVTGVVARDAVSALSLSRFEAPGSESRRAAGFLREEFSTGSANVTLLISAKRGTVDDPAVATSGRALAAEAVADPRVAEARSYWGSGSPLLASTDRRHALILLRLPGSATETRGVLADFSPHFTRDTEHIRVSVGGGDEVFRQVGAQAGRDFVRAEAIIFPGALILLALIFRSFVAALLPIGVGLFAMVCTLAALRATAQFTEVSTFALNLTLVLGLGLGIDYGLIVIARFREARCDGASVPEAVAVSLSKAGRTVVHSGIVVAASLAAMLVFPFPFLRSFGYAGIAVVSFAVIGAAVILPAVLVLIGHRIRPAAKESGNGLWQRTSLAVMKRPAVYGGLTLAALLFLGSPFMDIRFGLPDDRVLPAGTSSREVQQIIRDQFPAEEMDALLIVAKNIGDPSTHADDIRGYAEALSHLDGIARVDSLAGSFAAGKMVVPAGGNSMRFSGDSATWLSAVPLTAGLEQDPSGLVQRVRALSAPFETAVGGYPADLADFRSMVLNRLPLVLGIIFTATFAILFLITDSLVLPVKATLLNLLSMSVMFGCLVFVFQQGNFSTLLNFTPTGWLETSIPILMFCIVYGLSMDYEVFMLSRIKEEYDRGASTIQAVATGLQISGPLISSAAIILALSFLTYLSSGVVFLKMLGLGTALAILVDATLIRALLMPAFMRIAGDWNWWSPAPLKRAYQWFSITEPNKR